MCSQNLLSADPCIRWGTPVQGDFVTGVCKSTRENWGNQESAALASFTLVSQRHSTLTSVKYLFEKVPLYL